jgi:hypothetical protein
MTKMKNSKKDKGTYAVYAGDNRRIKNRKRKLVRHLKLHPNDAQATSALKTDGTQKRNPQGHKALPKRSFYRDAAGHKIFMPTFAPVYTK